MITILDSLPIQLAAFRMEKVSVTHDATAFDRLTDCAASYHQQYGDCSPGEVDGVQHARHFFRAVGIDPTKRRPSSEALLRRALKGKELYKINTLVDVGNWCSLDFLLPICIYDMIKIEGSVSLRLGQPGESYEALNHRQVNFEGRFVIADDQGPFGSPMTDSLRTAVSLKTTDSLQGIFAPLDYDTELLKEQALTFIQRATQICGGQLVEMQILRGQAK